MKRKILSVLFALVLVLTFSLVTAVPAGAATLTVGAGQTYATITLAIAAAAAGDTISVVAGTYSAESSWPISVSKALTIQSVAGAATTIIDPGASGQGAIAISADNVTVDGFTIKQGTEAVTAGNQQEHTVWVLANYATIKNNTIIGAAGNQACIYIGNRQANIPTGAVFGYIPATPANSRLGHTIQGNTFRYGTATTGSGEGWGIFAYDLSDSLIKSNYFVGDAADVGAWNTNEGAPGTGIVIHTATAGTGVTRSPGSGSVVIENNTARYLKYTWLTFYAAYQYVDSIGGGYEQPEASTVDKVIVRNNTVYDCGTNTSFASGTAVNFHRASKSSAYGAKGAALTVGSDNVTIGPGNTFYNLAYGVKIDAPTLDADSAYQCVLSADKIIIINNNIYSTQTNGVYNGTIVANQVAGAKIISAETNWWGSASGPTHSGNTFNSGSQGAIVTDSVDYVPWLNGVYLTGTSFAPVKNTSDSPVSTYSSILAAIAAGTTATGETITCEAGSYNGTAESFPIAITKGIILRSVAGAATTNITPGANGQGAIAISADSVTVDGFTIKQGTEAVTAGNPQEHTVWVAANYATIKNNTIIGAAGNQACLYIGDRQAGVPTASAIYGYKPATPANSRLGHTIQGNTFRYGTATAGSGEGWGIFAYDLSDSLIKSNNFVGDAADVGAWNTNEGAPGTGIVIHTATAATGSPSPGAGYVVIENNTARYLKYTWLTFYAAYQYVDAIGGGYEQPEASTVDKVIVRNNTVYQCGTDTSFAGGTAVAFKRAKKNDAYGVKGADLTVGTNKVTIGPGNTFYNLDEGVSIDEPRACTDSGGYACVLGSDNITIKYNDIYSTQTNGVYNGTIEANQESGATTISGKYNYWGDASGPTISGNDRGAGANITASVTYEPWLHTTQATVYPSGVRYYGYNWCSLTTGWNVWSTPIALGAQADTWGEYKALGVDLALGAGSNAYYFNGSTQLWASVTDSYELTPSDAIYINMASAQTSPILFSPTISAPSKALSAGWNLVSASYINNMDSPTIATGVAAQTALASAYYVAGTNNIGYGQVVSPAAGQTAWSSVRGPAIDTTTGQTMLPCKGYWVYMTNAGTLAGTVFTPVSPLQ